MHWPTLCCAFSNQRGISMANPISRTTAPPPMAIEINQNLEGEVLNPQELAAEANPVEDFVAQANPAPIPEELVDDHNLTEDAAPEAQENLQANALLWINACLHVALHLHQTMSISVLQYQLSLAVAQNYVNDNIETALQIITQNTQEGAVNAAYLDINTNKLGR